MIKEKGNRREDIKLGKWFRRPDIYSIEIPERNEAEYVDRNF